MDIIQSSENRPAIAIAIVTRNRSGPLLKLLEQIHELDYPDDRIDIFLADNGSTDRTVEKVRHDFPKAKVMDCRENMGITKGFNLCITAALNDNKNFRYIWLLDDDVVIERETLNPLLQTLEMNSSVAAVGSAVYDIDRPGHLVTAGLNVDWKRATLSFNRIEKSTSEQLVDIDIVAACSSLVRADLFGKLGIWDECFWLYWGDTDWCIRAKKNGFRICCHALSRVWHRNWAYVTPDFGYPQLLHDRIRGGLLFNFRHSANNSLKGVRHLVLKSYLKAVMEKFSLRPNFSRAATEAVQDFMTGIYPKKVSAQYPVDFTCNGNQHRGYPPDNEQFPKKSSSRWQADIKVTGLETICNDLKNKIPAHPAIILNKINDSMQRQMIKEIFQRHFIKIEWSDIREQKQIRREHLGDHYYEYLFFHFPQLVIYLLNAFRKKDIIISSIANPDLYNILAARYTVLVNASLNACLIKRQISKTIWDAIKLVLKGLKISYIDLLNAPKHHIFEGTETDTCRLPNQLFK